MSTSNVTSNNDWFFRVGKSEEPFPFFFCAGAVGESIGSNTAATTAGAAGSSARRMLEELSDLLLLLEEG
jgi:hypothetical protein